MMRPAELVPIPEYLLGPSLVPPEGFGKFAKIKSTFRQNFAKNIWQNSEEFGNNLATKTANFDEITEIRER